MKKLLSISLALTMLFALTSCGDKGQDQTEPDTKPSVSDSAELDTSTPAKALYAEFKKSVADGKTAPADIADALVNAEIMPFMAATMEVSEGWLNGFDEEIKGFKSGMFFGPMIGTIPFVGYIFEVGDSSEADALMATLNEKSNLAWNVCTQADEKLCEADGNLVFFVMAPNEFEEEPPADNLG